MADSSEHRRRMAALHNQVAGDIVGSIVRPVVGGGGEPRDILVLLESVALGVCLFLEQTAEFRDKPEALIDQLADGIKVRWGEMRAERRRASH